MIEILYCDKDIVVCVKPQGVSSESTQNGDGLCDMLKQQLAIDYIATLHRLDTGVGGVMVYALNKKSAAILSKDIQEGKLNKYYRAKVYGVPQESSGIYTDFLFKDSKKNKSFVVKKERRGVKKASLSYEVLEVFHEGDKKISLVETLLFTGRSHQIRVQFSSRGMPLVGDGKYGACDNVKNIALCSYRLQFTHPTSKQMLEFTLPQTFFQQFI